MKKYIKTLIILIIQLILFYLFPLTAGPTDVMGMVVIMFAVTFVLGMVLGIIERNKIKFLFPVIIALLFIPTICIYYNWSAFSYTAVHMILSYAGLGLGILVSFRKT